MKPEKEVPMVTADHKAVANEDKAPGDSGTAEMRQRKGSGDKTGSSTNEAQVKPFAGPAPQGSESAMSADTRKGSWALEVIAMILATALAWYTASKLQQVEGQETPVRVHSLDIHHFVEISGSLISLLVGYALSNVLSQYKWVVLAEAPDKEGEPLQTVHTIDAGSHGFLGAGSWAYHGPRRVIAVIARVVFTLRFIMGHSTGLLIDHSTKTIELLANDTRYSTPQLPYVRSYGTFEGRTWPSFEMERAWSHGLFSTTEAEVMRSSRVSCPTGNCKWPDLTTLGICSTCTNRTDEIKWCDADTDRGLRERPTFGGLVLDERTYFSMNFSDRPILTEGPRVSSRAPYPRTLILNASLLFDHSFPAKNLAERPDDRPFHQPATAMECLLHLCIHNISTTTTNGTTSQTVTSSINITTQDLEPTDQFPEYYDYYGWRHKAVQYHGIRNSDGLEIRRQALTGLTDYLVPTGPIGSIYGIRDGPVYNAWEFRSILRAFGQAYMRNDTVGLFDRIALSLTNAIRSEPIHSKSTHPYYEWSPMVNGTAQLTIECVRIQWRMDLFALFTLGASWSLLFWVMYSNGDATLWKSHPLAVLAIDDGVGAKLKACRSAKPLTKKSHEVCVRLEKSKDKLMLVKVKEKKERRRID